jgi:hypothetical protein
MGSGQVAGSIQKLPKLANFAHLLHFTGGSGGPENALVMTDFGVNPGFLTRTGVSRDSGLQAALDRMLAANAKFTKLKIALVDLTKGVNTPQFAGHRELEMGTIGSTGKMSVMYTAFQLRFDLEVHAFLKNLKTAADVFAAARESWSLSQIESPGAPREVLHAGSPLIERAGSLILRNGKKMPMLVSVSGKPPALQDAPLLEDMFDVTPAATGAKVSFSAAFLAKLKLMTLHSDNNAAHHCATHVGFAFADSALWQMGLYNPNRGSGGGQWMGGSYAGTVWGPPPVGGNFKQGGTAATVAALHTLLAQERLVNKAASVEMKNVLLDPFTDPKAYGSWLLAGLTKKGLFNRATGDRIFTKLGIADNKIFDAVHFDIRSGRKPLRYIAVTLNAPQNDFGEKLYFEIAPLLHDIIVRNNP